MKKNETLHSQWIVLTLRLLLVLTVFIIVKILFIFFNYTSWETEQKLGFLYRLKLSWGIIRYDIVAISIINLPFIFLTLLPFRFAYHPIYIRATALLAYYIPNIAAFSFDFIDIIYSRFTQRRMTSDVFRFIGNEEGITSLIPYFFRDYWFIFLLYFLCIALFIIVNRKIASSKTPTKSSFFISRSLPSFFIFISLAIIGSRGGFQLRPLSVANVSSYAIPSHYMVVLNTPFTLIKSIGKSTLEMRNYFSEEELSTLSPVIWSSPYPDSIPNRNVVILILESFSLEHSGVLNPRRDRSLTPTLDSLGKSGIMLPFYANGTRSMEGIPAILAGIPTWMDSEYITSPYSGNKISALPTLLKKTGYTSAFFHGGKNGTMNFDAFTQLAGFDYYFGKNEYPDDNHYDGNWGIFDDHYLPYCAQEISQLAPPFFASIFTLSSHHPYTLPQHYRNLYPEKGKSMPESIEYADWALAKFFAEASKQPWFSNTIFIITADHAAQSDDPYFKTKHARYTIPFIIFDPQNKIDTISKAFGQQIDILPTILELLHYPHDVFAFGNSLFDETFPAAINFQNGIYQIITERYALFFDGEKITGAFEWQQDPFLTKNSSTSFSEKDCIVDRLKAIIQQYNNHLLKNTTTHPVPKQTP